MTVHGEKFFGKGLHYRREERALLPHCNVLQEAMDAKIDLMRCYLMLIIKKRRLEELNGSRA